jgi:hypothetical protein
MDTPDLGRIRPVQTRQTTPRRRATRLAVVVAAVVAAPVAAQSPAYPPTADPNRAATVVAPQSMPLPAIPLIPYGSGTRPVAPAGYDPSEPPTVGQRQVWLAAPARSEDKGVLDRVSDSISSKFGHAPAPRPTVSLVPTGPQVPLMVSRPGTSPYSTAPPAAPAWQWHGYGAARPANDAPYTINPTFAAARPVPSAALSQPQAQPQTQPPAALSQPQAQPTVQPPVEPSLPPLSAAPWRAHDGVVTAAAFEPPVAPVVIEPQWLAPGARHEAPALPPTPPPPAPEPQAPVVGRVMADVHDPWRSAIGPQTVSAPAPASMPYKWHGYGAAVAPPSAEPQATAFRAPAAAPRAQLAVPQPTSWNPIAPASYRAPGATLAAPTPAPRQMPTRTTPRAPEPPPVIRQVSAAQPRPAVSTLAQLKAGIAQACVGKGRDLEVMQKGPGSLVVRVKVRKSGDAEALASRIALLPELAPYEVAFQMQIAP